MSSSRPILNHARAYFAFASAIRHSGAFMRARAHSDDGSAFRCSLIHALIIPRSIMTIDAHFFDDGAPAFGQLRSHAKGANSSHSMALLLR